ncbi:uncharacterized protein LOC134675561 [Cydia fagiglandana]|uniref:uncharacterized protein LOC134675561 n=1 Tax=Cydia fagiglandana TaxID=1458189 RepID=UPI002FEE1736
MTSTNDGKDVKSNQTSGHKGKSYYIDLYTSLEKALNSDDSLEERTKHVCEAWRRVYSLYQHSATSTHPHLLSWLQRHTANTILQSKWAKSKNEQTRLTEAIDGLVAEATAASAGRPQHPWEQVLLQRAAWFKKALENPWDNPVLKSLINPNSEPVTDQQVLEWLISEHGVVLVTRLQRMVGAGNCDDLALLLASAVMDRARAAIKRLDDDCADQKVEEEDSSSFIAVLEREASFTSQEWEMLTDIELVLLLKTDKRPRCIELAKLTPLRHGYKMVERLRKRLEATPRDKKLWKHAKEVATIVTQVIIARSMVLSTCAGAGRDALYWCARALARLLAPARLRAAAAALAAPAATARHLHTFCAALSAECKELQTDVPMKPFICELYVRSITAGMNELEQLKLKPEKESEARLYSQTLAGWFTQLGGRLADSVRLRAECALTAFSVHPAREHYERVACTKPPPRLPPFFIQAQESTPETTSEYGSWANDSRTQSNLVKTSETLQLKQSQQHQANVLSTAILTEGEALGLEPELCQDLAVLLSGPRVKTLSWDMDREVLLENCRSYMEKTRGGTRAVTTELKYLNLDPNAYQHLPEEEDDENDVYYGIEKGYEHEVQFEEPEEIWQNAFFDPEQTESADDSEVDRGFGKKKSKASVVDSEDEDPLSTIADAKKEKKKRAKEKDKEQRKKKTHKRDDSKDGSTERRKDKDKKTKKERKKDKSEQPAAGSLNCLLGMKVAKVSSPVQDGEKRVRKKKERRRESTFSYVSVTNSDQISDDHSVLVDGVFSMDELKSPERLSADRQKLDNTKTTIKSEMQSPVINDIKTRPMSSPTVTTTSSDSDVTRAKSPYLTPNQLAHRHVVNPQVKSSLHKLLQFRRNQNKLRAVARPAPAHTQTQTNLARPPSAFTQTYTNLARPPSAHTPIQTNMVRPAPSHTPTHTNLARPPPAHTPTQGSSLVGMKIYNPDDVPKVYLNKKQCKQLETMSNDMNNILKGTIDYMSRTPCKESKDKLQSQQIVYNSQKYPQQYNDPVHMSQNVLTESQKLSEYTTHSPVKAVQNVILNQSLNSTQTNYASPAKTAEHVRPHDLNVTPPKPTIVYHPLHKSMQNLSTDKQELPKKPLLINDPNYFSQQHVKANVSQLSPKIISNTVIKPPSQITTAKDDFTKSPANSNIHRTYMSKPVQNVNSQMTNLNSELMRSQTLYERQKLSNSMQNITEVPTSSYNATKRHIPTPQDMLHGRASNVKPYNITSHSDALNSAQPLHSNNSAQTCRSGTIQNRERVDTKTPLISETNEIDEFLKEIYKSIHAGADKNVSVALNKDVKLTIQTPSTTVKRTDLVTPQCAKQPLQQKKSENVPTTFSRLSYMHKNKQNEIKVPLTDSINVELNKKIIEHKLSKAKCLKNEITISRVGITNPDARDPQKAIRRIDQSGSALKRGCPLLSSMLESTGSPTVQPHSNTPTTIHNAADNLPNREDADLLLLLRNPTLMKPNVNIYIDNASMGSLTSDGSHQTLNPQTKVETEVSKQTLVGTKVKNINILDTCSTKKESSSDDEWKRVMDAIRARKTEPLGPNALELALKKDPGKYSQGSSRTSGKRVSEPGQSLLQNKSSDTKKREHYSSKASSTTRNPSTDKHSEVPKKPRNAEVIKKTSSEMLKKLEVHNKQSSQNMTREVPRTSAIPNSDFDMLDDLIDDDLRRELGEISSDEDAYTVQTAPVVAKGKSHRHIPKSNSNVSKAASTSKEKTHIGNPKTIIRKNQTNSTAADSFGGSGVNTYSTTDYTTVIVNNSSHPAATHKENSPTESKSETVQQYAPTTTIITDQVAQNTANNILTHIEAHQYVNNILPTNVILASVPQSAPVVVIRQDLVYDPYPTIRIHESQVNAELCAINQNVFAVNAAPNLALYQTTQFAAPVINPFIIGNATTTTNVSNPTAIGNEHVTQDFEKEDLDTPVEDSISLETALRLSDAVSETPEPPNLDFNMNRNSERKVLTKVHENHTDDVEKESHISRLSNDDVPLKTEQDKQRIELKRQSLINRKISHLGGLPPIALTYTPLSKNVTLGKLLQQESPKNGTVKPNPRLMPSTKNGIVAATASVKTPATEANNENIVSTVQASSAKENKQSCRRIWLRSSNKITNKKVAPVKRPRMPLNRNTIKLKVKDNAITHENTTVTIVKNENKDSIKMTKRASNRILNKNKKDKNEPSSPLETQQNVADTNELIDFEEELNSSIVLKSSVAMLEARKLEDTSMQELESNDSVTEQDKQLEVIKNTEVTSQFNKKLEPTVVIKKLKDQLGGQIVIKSTSAHKPEDTSNDSVTEQDKQLEVIKNTEVTSQFNKKLEPTVVIEKLKDQLGGQLVIKSTPAHKPEDLSNDSVTEQDKQLEVIKNTEVTSQFNKKLEPTVVIEKLKDQLDDQLVIKSTPAKTSVKEAIVIAKNQNLTILANKDIDNDTNDCVIAKKCTSNKIDVKAIPKTSGSEATGPPLVVDEANELKATVIEDKKVIKQNTAVDSTILLGETNKLKSVVVDDQNCVKQDLAVNLPLNDQNVVKHSDTTGNVPSSVQRRGYIEVRRDEFKNNKSQILNIVSNTEMPTDTTTVIKSNTIIISPNTAGTTMPTNAESEINIETDPRTPAQQPPLECPNVNNSPVLVVEDDVEEIIETSTAETQQKNTTDVHSNTAILKCNPLDETLSKGQQETIDTSKSLLCKENINEVLNDKSANQNFSTEKVEEHKIVDRQLSNQKQSNINAKPETQHDNLNEIERPELQTTTNALINASRKNAIGIENSEKTGTYTKGDIKIEEEPLDDPNKKIVRVSLPNGKVIKATFTGKVHADFDSLFEHPTMRAMLEGHAGKYNVNYKQVQMNNDTTKIFYRIQDLRIKQADAASKPIDTVNLISDDEDDELQTRSFNTEYGKYCTNHDQETIALHQKKFDQRCEVKMLKGDLFKSNRTKPKSKSLPLEKNSLLTRHQTKLLSFASSMTSIITQEVDSNADKLTHAQTAPTPLLAQTTPIVSDTTDVIEIDDSSNDGVETQTLESDDNKNIEPVKAVLANLLLQNLGVETDKVNLPSPVKSGAAVVNLKSALLQDLGIVPAETPVIDITENDDEEVVLLADVQQQNKSCDETKMVTNVATEENKIIRNEEKYNLKKCVVKIVKCETLIKKYELMKKMKHCYVKMERLNNSILQTERVCRRGEKTSDRETDEINQDNADDFIEFDVDEPCSSPQLSRCPSLSILNSWDDDSQPSLENPYCTSPVMEIYDTLVQLRNKLKTELVKESKVLLPSTCDSEWTMTKFGYSTQEILSASSNVPVTELRNLLPVCDNNNTESAEKLIMAFETPKLLTITLKFLEDNPNLLCRWEFARRRELILKIKSSPNKLKRKAEEVGGDIVSSKVLKLRTLALKSFNSSLETPSMAISKENMDFQSDTFEAQPKYKTTTVENIEDVCLIVQTDKTSNNDMNSQSEDKHEETNLQDTKMIVDSIIDTETEELEPAQSDTIMGDDNVLQSNEVQNSVTCLPNDIDTFDKDFEPDYREVSSPSLLSDYVETFDEENKINKNFFNQEVVNDNTPYSKVITAHNLELMSPPSLSDSAGGDDGEKQTNTAGVNDLSTNDTPTHSRDDNSGICLAKVGDENAKLTSPPPFSSNNNENGYENKRTSISVSNEETELNGLSPLKEVDNLVACSPKEINSSEVKDIIEDIQEVTSPSLTNNNEFEKESDISININNEETVNNLSQSNEVEYSAASSSETDGLDRDIIEDNQQTISPLPRNDNAEADRNKHIGINLMDVIEDSQEVTSPSLTDNNEFDSENDINININNEEAVKDVSQPKEVEYSAASSNETEGLDRGITEDNQQTTSPLPRNDISETDKEKQIDINLSSEEAVNNMLQLMDVESFDSFDKDILTTDNQEEMSPPPLSDNTQTSDGDEANDLLQSKEVTSSASSPSKADFGKDFSDDNQEDMFPPPLSDNTDTDDEENQMSIINSNNRQSKEVENYLVGSLSEIDYSNKDNMEGIHVVTAPKPFSDNSETVYSDDQISIDLSETVTSDKDATEDTQTLNSPIPLTEATVTKENQMSKNASNQDPTTDTLHIEEMDISDRLDEISIDELPEVVSEVVVIATDVPDIDIVETLMTSKEITQMAKEDASAINHDSEIKSPDFIDSKTITFNYHDYTKQSKKKQDITTTNSISITDCTKKNVTDFNIESLSLMEQSRKDTPSCEIITNKNCPLKSKPECKYELIQEDDFLTVNITTENDEDKTKAVCSSPNVVEEDTVVVASPCSNNADDINLKGFEFEDVYIFPLSQAGSNNSNLSNDSLVQESNIESATYDVPNDLHDIDFHVKEPEMTYSRKRKMSMREVKVSEKKYRKGKNIDCSKQTQFSMIELAYSKEYKRLLEYCSSVKFSYSRPFHKECIEIEDLMDNWPINSVCYDVALDDVCDERLFVDLEDYDSFQPDPATQTFVEEISYEYNKTDAAQEDPKIEASETNFNMGFGEGSGRVIQILKKQSESNISAATLSDVKQSQPVSKSVDPDDCKHVTTNNDDEIKKIRQHVNFIELRDKVRQFFKKSTVELKSDWVKQNTKDEFPPEDFPFGLCSFDYVKPVPTNVIVQVVQVGQLPVSAAAQNPVTCDPRVTQVSDASPSQCSVDNSPNDDSQSEIKTEYTELTTADLSLPLQEYAQQNQANLASQDSNVELIEQTISLEMEIKAEESPEIKQELPDIKEEKSNSSDTELHTLNNTTPENTDYSFENNTAKSDASSVNYDSSEKNSSETFPQQRQQNGTSEKTDQIAHAMSAAGITTTPEAVTNTRAHALVNILSQKIRQGSVNTTQTTTNTYSKTSINAMALQQALAQILPPPLNQTGSSENSQSQSTPVGPQVLHIVQGKNSSGNQITLVDNSQQSVISTPNATQVLHIVQNKNATSGQASNGTLTPQANSFSGLSLVDAGLQQGGNQLLHIVNTGNQKTGNPGQLLKRVNLLTNLTNVQGSNEQKMVQFVCKSADGKAIQLNAPHQRSMVLRLQPIETPNVQAPATKPAESQELNTSPTGSTTNKESASQQEIKSRSIYEENYAKFIQNSSSKTPGLEKSTSLPKFNQAFGKQVFQEGSQKQGETATNNSHLTPVNNNSENAECPANDNAINLEHMGNISSPPLLIRKPVVTTQSQSNIVQQIKQTIAPMNIQTMHGGVIYTRQIPVNIGGGQTINLITVPSTELINDDSSKTQSQNNQGEIEPSIIKIVPQGQTSTNNDSSQEESNSHASGSNENAPTPQPQPVLTQMRIKLPMLSKAPQMVPGARVVRPSFFQIQRNVIGGANQPVYQQLVLTAAPPLGQQTIRLPSQASRPVKVPSENQSSSSESQMSSSTLEQLREFDMVLEQVKERSTSTPSANSNNSSFKIHSSDTTDGNASSNCSTESTSQVLYSIGNNQSLNVAYVNRKTTVTTPTTSTYVRSPDSSGIADSPTSSTHAITHTVTTDSSPTEMSSQSKPKVGSKSKSRPKSTSNPPNTLKLSSSVPPKTSSQKPLEDEQTTQRILYILAEYKEQVENSPDKDKPAPRRRSNPPSNPGSSKRKKSSSSRRSGTRDTSPVHGEDTCRTMGSEDSSCGTSQGDCTESCLDSHSPQDSPRKVARKITFDQDLTVTQPRPQPQRNVIVADGQTITVARGTTGKPATAVLMPANYILPVSMVKGGQQIAIVTNRGPKLLTVGGEGGATNALLLQRLIGPAGLKPVLARPGVRHVRLPTAALHNLQAFNLATATTVQPPDSTASPTPGPTPPELVDTRATSSPWTDRDEVKPERSSSPEGSEPWNLPSTDAHDYTYEETVRTDNMDRTVLDQIPDRYSPDMEAQRIFDKMFDVDSKKSYAVDSPRCAYDIDPSDCDDKAYQVVQKKDGSQRQHRLAHVSAAALRHKYAILEHELRLQKSLSEECEDLGVDSPSASELFPEAELLFANSPAHEHNQEHHSHTPQPLQTSIPQPDMDDQIATDHLIPREIDVSLGLGDVGIVAVSEDGSATIALDQEEFARSHPNTTFHSEPTEGEVQPFTIAGIKGRHITSTIFHSNSAPATVLMTAPQATVISQAPEHSVKYEIENMINSMPSSHNNDINLSSVLVKDDGLTRFDNILTGSRELHLTNTTSAIVHSSGNATQVIRRVCYEDDKRERDARYLIDEPDNLIAGDDAKMIAEDSSRDATLESMADVDDDRSSPERHAELFWESNSASERSESRRPLDFSSDSDKCCKSPSFDETNSTDSSGVGAHMRLDSVIKEARGRDSGDGSSADDAQPPPRTYPAARAQHAAGGARSLSGKTRAGEQQDGHELRRRASGRGVVKRGCHCCNGSPSPSPSPAPPRPKKPRQRKPTLDFNTDN